MKRIQRKRTKGWRMPPNSVYVGRPSRWSNLWTVGKDGTLEQVLEKYRRYVELCLMDNPNFLKPLKGKDLVCWCPLDKPCHADIFLKILDKSP